MIAFLLRTDDLLRGRLDTGRTGPIRLGPGQPSPVLPGSGSAAGPRGSPLAHLLATLLVFGLFYGAVMGAFGMFAARGFSPGPHSDLPRQMLYSALKVPLLLLVTFGLSLPSFFVLNTLMGVRSDFGQVLRGLVATQAGLTVVLAALGPLTAFWYASVPDYNAALVFNAGAFGIASLAAQGLLRRAYRPLVAANPRHRALLRTWVVIYAFVGIQMAWVLRPFVGNPHTPTSFFRAEAWGNAYEQLTRSVWKALY